MRPVLLRTDSFTVGSFPSLVTLAVALAVVALAVRAERRDLDQPVLVRTIIITVLAGWVGVRVLSSLVTHGVAGLQWGLLLPTERVGQSLSAFLLVAFPIALVCLARQRGRMLAYLDAIAPSLLIGVAVAKIGCLLAGCCAGRECPPTWGIRYPYGSLVYWQQWQSGRIDPPAPLLRTDAEGRERLLGHAAWLSAQRKTPPPALVKHAQAHGLSVAAVLDRVASQRSLPVWPVPVWYIITASLLWIVAEILFRRTRQVGWTTGFVLVAYASMRLGFDGFVAVTDRLSPNLTISQLTALPIAVLGIALLITCLRRPKACSRPAGPR